MRVMGSEENRKTLICSIVGDCMVGKTLICKTLTGQAMTDGYTATVSDEYTYDTFMFGEDYTIKIKDLSGQHDYHNMRTQTYKDTDIFILCYSDADRDSFVSIEKFWVPEIRKNNKKSPIILVSTSNDKHEENEKLSNDEKLVVIENCKIDRFTNCRCHVMEDVTHLLDDISLMYMKQKRRRRSSVLQSLHDLVTK